MDNEADPSASAARVPAVPKAEIAVFWETEGFAETAENAARDRRMARANVYIDQGGIAKATATYRGTPSPNLVVVESRAQREQLMEELKALALECVAGTKVLVVGERNDVDLYRDLLQAGVSDYLVAPLSSMDLITATARCVRTSEEEGLGRIIAFIGAKGGSGSSTIAHNVAAAIAQQSDADVLVADLDLQFGILDLNYDVDPTRGMKDILSSTERVDDVLLQRIAINRSGGLHLLPAGANFGETPGLKEADVERLLHVAKDSSFYMVLDLPHYWGAWTKKILSHADEIVITATPDLASLRNAKNMIETLVKARPTDSPPRLIINKVGTPGIQEIKPEEFAEAVKAADSTSIPYDARLFSKASNEGRMITETARGSNPARALSEIAYKVTGRRERRKKFKPGLRNLFGMVGGQRRWSDKPRPLRKRAKAFKGSEEGVSAVEFAFIAPIMALGLVAMADVGLALHERMNLDHVLRAGAQAAMSDPGKEEVERVMRETLAGAQLSEGVVVLKVSPPYCACPESSDISPDEAQPCATLTCDGSAAPYVYYRMEASKPYEPMSLPEVLPDFTLSSSMQVQIK